MGPVAAQTAITRPAATKAQVDPNQAEADAANRPKWSWNVGVCTSVGRLFIHTSHRSFDTPNATKRCTGLSAPIVIGQRGRRREEPRLRYTSTRGGLPLLLPVRRVFTCTLIGALSI